MRAILQNRTECSLYKKIFWETFCPVSDSLVFADMSMQKCGQKETYFSMEKKHTKLNKADEKRILCKSSFTSMTWNIFDRKA